MFKSFAARLSMVFFLLCASVLSVLFAFLYFKAVHVRETALRDYIGNMTEVSARLIPGEEVQAVPLTQGCEKLPETQRVIRKLQSIKAVNKAVFDVYLMVWDDDPAFLRFVTNADRDRTPVGCGERYDISQDPEIVKGFRETFVNLDSYSDKWGTWISGCAPVRTASGEVVALLGMDVAQETVEHLRSVFWKRFLLTLALCLGASLVLGFVGSLAVTAPIRRVVSGMEKVAGGNLDYQLERFSQTEFDRIASIFNKMIAALKQIMREREVAAREHERVRRELEIAGEIQGSIFPAHPPQVDGLEIEAKSVPAKEVGGDYFDFFKIKDHGRMGVMIADAAGKGLPGTLYMTRSRSVFQVISSEEQEPGKTLSRSNEHIAADASSRKGMFITALYLLYDKRTKKMTYSNAGHYHPLWFKNREKTFGVLTAGGVPVGISPAQNYPQETVQLASNDFLVLYTDGLIEARNEKGEMFGIGRLTALISENPDLSARRLFVTIEKALYNFIGNAPPFDDMTFIVIRVL